jgi:phenylacetate-CoA ligase
MRAPAKREALAHEQKNLTMEVSAVHSKLPILHHSIDWDTFFRKFPVPDVFEQTVYKWPRERFRALQNERFSEAVARGWQNEFYRRRWQAAGLEPGDIRSIDDADKLPTFNSDDIKDDQQENPPFGLIHGEGLRLLARHPLKLHTSGGTTGRPRPTLYGPIDWEMNAITEARGLYIQGARPGDVMQIPSTVVAPATRDRVCLGHQSLAQFSRISDSTGQGLQR